MKKYIIGAVVILIILLITSLSILGSQYKKLQEEYEIAVGNEKILLQDCNNLKNNVGVLQLSVAQLEYSNDSILTKLNDTRKRLKIKDKELKGLLEILFL